MFPYSPEALYYFSFQDDSVYLGFVTKRDVLQRLCRVRHLTTLRAFFFLELELGMIDADKWSRAATSYLRTDSYHILAQAGNEGGVARKFCRLCHMHADQRSHSYENLGCLRLASQNGILQSAYLGRCCKIAFAIHAFHASAACSALIFDFIPPLP